MSIHDDPYVPLSDRAKRFRDQFTHPSPCRGGDECGCGLALDLLLIEYDARASVGKINELGAAWAEAEAALPERWELELTRYPGGYSAQAMPTSGPSKEWESWSEESAAAALRALAEKLREQR